jgi:two-component system sensor histidine kinase YesM
MTARLYSISASNRIQAKSFSRGQKKQGMSPEMNWAHLQSNRGTNLLVLGRIIYSESNNRQQLGYLVIMVEEKVFSRNTYRHVDLGTGSRIFLYNSDGTVVSSVSPSIPIGEPYAADLFERITNGSIENSFYTQGESKKLVTSYYIRTAGWHIVGMLPHSFLVSELSRMKQDIYVICIVTLLLSGLLSMWIYLSINSPMKKLLDYAKRIRMGQLQTKLGSTHSDEMGKLAETIDQMVSQLKSLIYQVESEQQAKRDAELKMLQAQINPHFLFNTLNSLKWSAMMSGNGTVTQGIESLSELLRNTILVKDDLIPLEKEIGNLFHYATIQRIRYGDSFKLSCSMSDDKLYEYLVPKFILQPIVENSILHAGGEGGRRVGISVEGFQDGSSLRIRIKDDGRGFNMDELYARKTAHSKLSGIGISNVNERIKIHFGPSYGLELHSMINEGTEIIISLPILKGKGENHV